MGDGGSMVLGTLLMLSDLRAGGERAEAGLASLGFLVIGAAGVR